MDESGSGIGAVIVFAIVMAIVLGQPWKEDNQIVAYHAYCENELAIVPLTFAKEAGLTFDQLRSNRKDCVAVESGRTTYSVDRTSGTVVYRLLDLPWLNTSADCTILDKENWTCAYSDRSGRFGFLDGFPTMFEEDTKYSAFYVKRWQSFVLSVLGPTKSSLLIPQQHDQHEPM